MEDRLKIFTSIIIISAFLIPNFQCFAYPSERTGVNLEVTGTPLVCNNNGVCEAGLGENSTNCPLDCPAAPPGGGGGIIIFDTTPPEIYNLLISKITFDSAEILWETNEQTFCQFFWGETQEYEKEVIVENIFYLKHGIALKNLLAGTKYHFKISCQDTNHNASETKDQEFITLTPPDTSPPANISNFRAIAFEGKIELKWNNPLDPDFKAVKIMRSTDFYPSDPWTGTPVYDGKEENFIDTGLIDGTRYYYTAFTHDLAGNYSSGAIISAVPNKPGITPPPEIITPASSTPPEIEKLNLEDFDFFQEGAKVVPADGKFNFKSGVPLTASLAYEKVPEVLKTIMITLKQEDKTFSFLLRVNGEKTRYEATILAPDPGVYPLVMAILNYKNQALKIINGQLVIEGTGASQISILWYEKINFWLYMLVVLLIILLAAHLIRRKIKKIKEQKKEFSFIQ